MPKYFGIVAMHSSGICVGQDECEHAVHLLEEEAKKVRRHGSGSRLFPLPLYAGLPAGNQLQALQPAPRGYRKVSSPQDAQPISSLSISPQGLDHNQDAFPFLAMNLQRFLAPAKL